MNNDIKKEMMSSEDLIYPPLHNDLQHVVEPEIPAVKKALKIIH